MGANADVRDPEPQGITATCKEQGLEFTENETLAKSQDT